MGSNSNQPPTVGSPRKRAWVRMEMDYLGNAAQLVGPGQGKLSLVGGDSGDNRKPSGQG